MSVADSEGNTKDVETSGMDSSDDHGLSPEAFKASSKLKRERVAPPPPIELGGSTWIPPGIQTIPSKPLAYRFKLPEDVRERVRAEMLLADADFMDEEKSRELQSSEREALAIRWICRILGVFAQEACRLASSGDPAWRASQVETRVDEVLQLLALEAEGSKFVGGYKPYLTQSGYVRASTVAKISRSPEWLQYIQALQRLLVRPAGSVSAAGGSAQAERRRELVTNFLIRCNQEVTGDSRITKQHIWRAAGYKQGRQFFYWQAGSDRATEEDKRTFGRILAVAPSDFVALLRKKAILSKP